MIVVKLKRKSLRWENAIPEYKKISEEIISVKEWLTTTKPKPNIANHKPDVLGEQFQTKRMKEKSPTHSSTSTTPKMQATQTKDSQPQS